MQCSIFSEVSLKTLWTSKGSQTPLFGHRYSSQLFHKHKIALLVKNTVLCGLILKIDKMQDILETI